MTNVTDQTNAMARRLIRRFELLDSGLIGKRPRTSAEAKANPPGMVIGQDSEGRDVAVSMVRTHTARSGKPTLVSNIGTNIIVDDTSVGEVAGGLARLKSLVDDVGAKAKYLADGKPDCNNNSTWGSSSPCGPKSRLGGRAKGNHESINYKDILSHYSVWQRMSKEDTGYKDNFIDYIGPMLYDTSRYPELVNGFIELLEAEPKHFQAIGDIVFELDSYEANEALLELAENQTKPADVRVAALKAMNLSESMIAEDDKGIRLLALLRDKTIYSEIADQECGGLIINNLLTCGFHSLDETKKRLDFLDEVYTNTNITGQNLLLPEYPKEILVPWLEAQSQAQDSRNSSLMRSIAAYNLNISSSGTSKDTLLNLLLDETGTVQRHALHSLTRPYNTSVPLEEQVQQIVPSRDLAEYLRTAIDGGREDRVASLVDVELRDKQKYVRDDHRNHETGFDIAPAKAKIMNGLKSNDASERARVATYLYYRLDMGNL